MVEVITISSKGQLVIPKNVRDDMGISQNDKFILVAEESSILLRRIDESNLKKRMKTLMSSASSEFKKAGIKQSDIQKEIESARRSK